LPFAMIYVSRLLDYQFNLYLSFSLLKLITGWVIASLSSIILLLAIFQLKKYSEGLPISALPPKKLAIKGIYAIWRHPIYLFFTLFFIGLALIIRSGSLLAIVIPVLIIIEIIYVIIEERTLIKRYGELYIYYKSTTSLIIPRFDNFLKFIEYVPFKLLFSYKVINKDNIPDNPPFFIISSHRNYLDPFFIKKIIKFPVHYVATFEIFRTHISRFVFLKLLGIPKKRYRNDISAIRKTMKLIDQKAVIGIFPEGERSWTGKISTFKPEVLKLLKKYHHIPILPIKLEGNYYSWPRWGKNIRRAKLLITVQKPLQINKNQTLEEIEKQLKKVIEPKDINVVCRSNNRTRDINKVIYRCPVCNLFRPLTITTKIQFKCVDCQIYFTILPDYSIKYYDGSSLSVQSINELYNKIKIREGDICPLVLRESNKDSIDLNVSEYIITKCDDVTFYKEKNNKLARLFEGSLFLTNRNIFIRKGNNKINIKLDKIVSVTVESNYKLQIYETHDNLLFQVTFKRESVLKWQDYIIEVIKHEFSFCPNRH